MASSVPLSAWVGRTQDVGDEISPVQVRQMAAALDDAPRMRQPDAAPLPPCWHWLYFNPLEVQSRLGEDGHPLRGDFLPPVELPRRMWAGSRLAWQREFRVGKSSEILKVEQKSGRSGEMVFVTVRHEYEDAHGPLLTEEHDIVYRGPPSAEESKALSALAASLPAGQHGFERTGQQVRCVQPDPVLLFRYSAASFNGHRIHYDADYCRDVEGYPGRVVHGPLIATLLLQHARETLGRGRFVAGFAFRAQRPTFDIGVFHLHASPGDDEGVLEVWSSDNLGRIGLAGRITLE